MIITITVLYILASAVEPVKHTQKIVPPPGSLVAFLCVLGGLIVFHRRGCRGSQRFLPKKQRIELARSQYESRRFVHESRLHNGIPSEVSTPVEVLIPLFFPPIIRRHNPMPIPVVAQQVR